MTPSILITRAQQAGLRFADALRAELGSEVRLVFSPVMRVEPCGARPMLDGIRQLIFTSRNGVAAFTQISDRRDIPCYTVGDATAELARTEGLIATPCGGNAERLITRILADAPHGPILHIRGAHGVGDIAARLTKAGIQTSQTVLYRQVAQPLNADALELLQRQAPVIIPLFSPRSARLIFEGSNGSAPLFVVAMSEAVAAAVTGGNVHGVVVANSPDTAGMLKATKAVLAKAKALEGDSPAQ